MPRGNRRHSLTDTERRVNDALFPTCYHGQSTAAKYVEHRRVLGEHVGLEPRDSVGARDVGELLEEAAGDPAAVKVLRDRESDVRGRAAAHVVGEPDDGLPIARAD